VRTKLILLGFIVLILLGVGLLAVASASVPECIKDGVDTLSYVKKQSMAMALGLFAAVCLALFDYHNWEKYPILSWSAFVIIVILLGAVYFNDESHGARRWIALGKFQFQPSEVAKFLGVILTAVAIHKTGWKLKLFWKGLFPILMGIGTIGALIICEPDYGGGLIFLGLTTLLLWIGRARVRHLASLVLIGALAIAISLYMNENRMRRIKESMKKDTFGYQVDNSIVAMREGGWTGRGYGNSLQKWQYLPEAHTDYIFAIIVEEGGTIFALFIWFLYLSFFGLGMYISRRTDELGRMICYGMTFLISGQAVANMAVVSGWGFSKGLALPFLSYGGSNIIVALMATGVIFSVGLRIIELPRGRNRCKIKKSLFFKGGK
jgi:cell division protein FtsW